MPAFDAHRIIGFDLRRTPLLDLQGPTALGAHRPSDLPAQAPFAPTISRTNWPRSAACAARPVVPRNDLKLLCLPDAQWLDPDAVSVAFSLRTADALRVAEASQVLLIDEGYLEEAFGWTLLGYDVVDAWLDFSGFYGFTWTPDDLDTIFAGVDVVFNRHGLIDDEPQARRIAEIFSNEPRTESHAPFQPVRVWVQRRT